MSICNCPVVGLDGIEDAKQKQFVARFLKQIEGDSTWNLVSLTEMAQAGNSVADIIEVVPFRGGPCNRSMRCCGSCTRQCYTRCIQDCLHRLFMWRSLVSSTPPEAMEELPLNIRMIAKQKFATHRELSWAVSEIISQHTNENLKEYMTDEQLRPEENPYKIDYAPKVDVDPSTGKRRVDRRTGELCILAWPETGLCPFCLPNVTIDGRIKRAATGGD